MTNTGAAGRFNRAQRGAFNTDEAMPLFLANMMLSGAVFGPAVLPLVLLSCYGRIKFALLYTEGQSLSVPLCVGWRVISVGDIPSYQSSGSTQRMYQIMLLRRPQSAWCRLPARHSGRAMDRRPSAVHRDQGARCLVHPLLMPTAISRLAV